MKIICAGLSRTGTKSLAAALRSLGFTVQDYVENLHYHLDEYCEAIDGKMPDFYAMYSNVDAVIALPVYMYWKELKETFPNAKVILMERDNVTSWARSFLTMKVAAYTSRTTLWNRLGMNLTPSGRKWKKIIENTEEFFNIARFRSGLMSFDEYSSLSDEERDEIEKSVSQAYNDHNSRVKAAIPRDDLLVYNVKQGWKPLCEFLKVDVPDKPFPRLNAGDQNIHALTSTSLIGNLKVFYELVFTLTILVAITAFGVFIIFR